MGARGIAAVDALPAVLAPLLRRPPHAGVTGLAHEGQAGCKGAAQAFIVPLAQSGMAGEVASSQAQAGTLKRERGSRSRRALRSQVLRASQ